MLEIVSTCLVITALLAYVNHRFIGMPTTIGVMVAALVLSLLLVGLDAAGVGHGLRQYEESFLHSIDFTDVLMQGMLSLLLFAGALHVDMRALRNFRWPVIALAVVIEKTTPVIVIIEPAMMLSTRLAPSAPLV